MWKIFFSLLSGAQNKMGLTWKVFKRKSTKIRHTIYKQSRKTSSQISREKNYVLHGIIYINILSSMVDFHSFHIVM